MPVASLTSPASGTSSITVTLISFWLKDPLDPTKNIAIAATTPLMQHRPTGAGIFYTRGTQKAVIVQTSEVRGWEFQLNIWALTPTQSEALLALLVSRKTLYIQDILAMSYYVQATADVARARLMSAGVAKSYHQYSAQFIEVDAP